MIILYNLLIFGLTADFCYNVYISWWIDMSYESLEKEFNDKGILKFKLYSLVYIVEKDINGIIIYAESMSNRKKHYLSFEQMLNNFMVYNEPLIENIDRMHILN